MKKQIGVVLAIAVVACGIYRRGCRRVVVVARSW